MNKNMTQRTALLSVYHKEGIVEFAQALQEQGFAIISSGGTARELKEAGVENVTDVKEITGYPAILGHRVVTLHPAIYGGILAKETDEHERELREHQIKRIHLVCVDMYPLEIEIAKPESTKKSIIEMTDIGGPTLLRAAAKSRLITICNPLDRQRVIDWLKIGEPDREIFINELATKAEMAATNYALTSARYISDGIVDGFTGTRITECAYGENAWQTPAGLYISPNEIDDPLSLDKFQSVGGSTLSYNNTADVDRLLLTATHIAAGIDINKNIFEVEEVPFMAIGVKHGNPCGTAIGQNRKDVLEKMIAGNPLALFGGLVMVNFPITNELAEFIGEHKCLFDGIIAPQIDNDAIQTMERKRGKCRMLVNPALASLNRKSLDTKSRFRYVRGGFLLQPNYTFVIDLNHPDMQRHGEFTSQQLQDSILAWAIGSTSNSNTITIVKNGMLLGNGVGQQARVYGAHTATYLANMAKHDLSNATAYSDSFFPFPDGVEELAKTGIKAILTSSGSIKDKDVIARAQELGVSMLLIPDKKARGFFGH